MKLRQLIFVSIILLFLFNQSVFAYKEHLIFQSQNESMLDFKVSDRGRVTGFYINTVAAKDCPQAVGQKRPILGYMEKNVITISFHYPDCASALGMVGNITTNQSAIETTWILAQQLRTFEKTGPGNLIIGHDVFHRIIE